MKLVIASCVTAALSLFTVAASAQEHDTAESSKAKDASKPKNTVTLNPMSLVGGVVSLEYERALHDRISVFLQPSVLAFEGVGQNWPKGAEAFGIGANAGARVFVTGRAPEGFWIGPQGGVAYVRAKLDGVTGTGVGYGAGGLLGYTFLFGDVVDLSLGGGVGYLSTRVKVNDREVGTQGVMPMARLAIGVAF